MSVEKEVYENMRTVLDATMKELEQLKQRQKELQDENAKLTTKNAELCESLRKALHRDPTWNPHECPDSPYDSDDSLH